MSCEYLSGPGFNISSNFARPAATSYVQNANFYKQRIAHERAAATRRTAGQRVQGGAHATFRSTKRGAWHYSASTLAGSASVEVLPASTSPADVPTAGVRSGPGHWVPNYSRAGLSSAGMSSLELGNIYADHFKETPTPVRHGARHWQQERMYGAGFTRQIMPQTTSRRPVSAAAPPAPEALPTRAASAGLTPSASTGSLQSPYAFKRRFMSNPLLYGPHLIFGDGN